VTLATLLTLTTEHRGRWHRPRYNRLGSVAGPVIQAMGGRNLRMGRVTVSGYSYHMSVRTGLPDYTIQTKFPSQRPSDVETPVPSY
jgi:hypothetical protein